MKKTLILTMTAVSSALFFCATVNAQSVNFISASANKEQGANIRFQTANPFESVFLTVEYALNPSFTGGTFFLKKYSYTDSLHNVTDSLDDSNYNFPAAGTTIHLRLTLSPDTGKWTPVLSSILSVTLKVKAKPGTISVVTKPYATASGAVTSLSLNSNVDFQIKKYVHFKDSAKVFSSGAIKALSFTAGKYTFSDTIPNLTQESWLGYEILNEISSLKTDALKVGQYVPPSKPWGQFDSLIGYADNLSLGLSIVGNTLSGNTNVYYKHEKDVAFSKIGPYVFTGNGVEKTNVRIPVTKIGKWQVCFSSGNSMGTFNSDTLTVDNTQGVATTIVVTPIAAIYDGPGKIYADFRVATTEPIDVYAMVSLDTTFGIAEPCEAPVKVTSNGDYRLYMNRLNQTGNLYLTFYYISKSGVFVSRIRPYLLVNVLYSAGLEESETSKVSVFPNPATIGDGFSVNFTGPQQKIELVDVTGKTVFTAEINSGDVVRPVLPAGLYLYKIGASKTGRIVFH